MPGGGLTVRSLVDSFFTNLTANQWKLMINGHLEDTTAPVGQLLLDIIRTLTTAFLAAHGETDVVTKESVKSSLGNTITDCFKAALDVTARGKSRSATLLRDMVSEEVMATIQMKLHITPPGRLDQMQALANKMITSIARRTTKVFTCSQGAEGMVRTFIGEEESSTSAFPQLPNIPDVTEGKRFGYNASTSHEGGDSGHQNTIFGNEIKCSWFISSGSSGSSCGPLIQSSSSEEGEDSDISFETIVMSSDEKSEPEPEELENAGPFDELENEEVSSKPLVQSSTTEEKGKDSDISFETIVRPMSFDEKSEPEPEELENAGPSDELENEEVSSKPLETTEDPAVQKWKKRALFSFLENLVIRTMKKCKLYITLMSPTTIAQLLMTPTWDMVKDMDFSSKTLKYLENRVFKELVKVSGGAELLLLDMRSAQLSFRVGIAVIIAERLREPPKPCSRIHRFFSFLGQVIADFY